jgi:hypothetical protein
MLASAPSWRGSLRLTDVTSVAVITTNLLIGGLTITIIMFCLRRGIIGVGGGG